MRRAFPIGAELVDGGVHFRVWAPARARVRVQIGTAENGIFTLSQEGSGYFAGLVPDAGDGTAYQFLLDDDPHPYPDPASRFQPDGPHGPSRVVDPARYRWTDAAWKGASLSGAVISEVHVGTFTPEGTWNAAAEKLPLLADTGISIVEVMPVADFPGAFGWGYDGVNLWAPTRLYGTPDDFRRFVDVAHRHGLAVILDVVYNHLGPDGNYLAQFAPGYFTDAYENEWGKAINFDGEDSAPVREFFVGNARYWIEEFHIDGLRLDATQQIFDSSPVHIIQQVTAAVRSAAGGRSTFVVAENETQEGRLVRGTDEGGFGLDALWNDDFHHSAIVALTGRREAYYTDYHGSPQELISAVRWGFLYQGQRYTWQKKRRGTPTLDLPGRCFITYLENHDQIANAAFGLRLWQQSAPGSWRAMTALLLLGPATPLLFQGSEFAASSPFLYFADHERDLATQVAAGRREFLAQFPSIASRAVQKVLADPSDRSSFEQCRLDWTERERHTAALALHRDLIALRSTLPFSSQDATKLQGAVLGPASFLLRFLHGGESDALLVVNLGASFRLSPAPEPLLAPPAGFRWETAFSTEDPAYGGGGTPELETSEGWWIPGQAAIVLRPAPGAPAD